MNNTLSEKKSKCCKATVTVINGEEGTSYYQCDFCLHACDIASPSVSEQKECQCNCLLCDDGNHFACNAHCSSQPLQVEGDWEKNFIEEYRSNHPNIDWAKAAPVTVPESNLLYFVGKVLAKEKQRTAISLLQELQSKQLILVGKEFDKIKEKYE